MIRPILLFSLLALSGCFGLSRGAPPQRYYVLGAGGAPGGTVPEVEADGPLIGLRPPRLAEYLASPFIVVREGTHRVGFSEFDRWGEDLDGAIQSAVARHLAARPPYRRVAIAPWAPESPPDYLVQLDVLHFEGVVPEDPAATEGEAHLLVNWEILQRQDGALLLRGVTEVREPGWTIGDFDGLVGLFDAGLGKLAEALALGVQSVPRPPN